MDPVWDGVTRPETLHAEAVQERHELADAAKRGDWSRVFELLSGNRQLANSFRPGGESWFAPLHYAAYGGAPVEVVKRLIAMGGWRALQNARGERPLDVADRRGFRHLLPVLKPVYKVQVPLGVLLKIQGHFHAVIRSEAGPFVTEEALRLPELEPLLELERPRMWFPVPGMYGGFNYWLEVGGAEVRLISESGSRVFGEPGQRHEITPTGSRLMEEKSV